MPGTNPAFPTAMASNPTPRNNRILHALACDLANGCRMHEATIGIRQNTEAALRAALATMEAADLDVGMKRLAVSAAYSAVEEADRDAIRVLTNCKLRVAWKLGERWNAGWEPTGFPDRSTAVPRTRDPRYVLLNSLKLFFTANPADESTEMEATAAICEAAHAALFAARCAAQMAKSALTAAYRVRRAAARALRKRVRGLNRELWGLIEKDDTRWLAFGFNIPARPAAPKPAAFPDQELDADFNESGLLQVVPQITLSPRAERAVFRQSRERRASRSPALASPALPAA